MDERPLRADAARNAERIIGAAAVAFAEVGADVSLEEIARRAGVGVATLYRRFPSKDELIIAVVEWRYSGVVEPVLRAALVDPDPWRGLVKTLEAALTVAQEQMSIIKASRDHGRVIEGVMSRFLPELEIVVRRAQEGGVVRGDVVAADVPALVFMLIGAARGSGGWRRYLALVLDGLRPGVGPPLPVE